MAYVALTACTCRMMTLGKWKKPKWVKFIQLLVSSPKFYIYTHANQSATVNRGKNPIHITGSSSILREDQTTLWRYALLSLWLSRQREMTEAWMNTHLSRWHSLPSCTQTGMGLNLRAQQASEHPCTGKFITYHLPTHCKTQSWLLLASSLNGAPVTRLPFYLEFCFPFRSLRTGTVTWLLQHMLQILPRTFILFTTRVFLTKHVLHLLSRTLLFLFHSLTGIDSILKIPHIKSRDCDLLQFPELCRLKRRSMKIPGNMRQHRCCLPGYEAGSLVHNIPDLWRRVNNSYHRLGWCCFLFWLLFWL